MYRSRGKLEQKEMRISSYTVKFKSIRVTATGNYQYLVTDFMDIIMDARQNSTYARQERIGTNFCITNWGHDLSPVT